MTFPCSAVAGAAIRARLIVVAALLLLTLPIAASAAPAGAPGGPSTLPYDPTVEVHNTGWAVYVDNDLLSFFDIDQDYTGGLAVTLSGSRATDYFFSMNEPLRYLNRLTRFRGMSEPAGSFQLHSVEFGFSVFTPEDIETSEAIQDDHPYASLVFLASTRQSIIPATDVSCSSTLTVGVLGSGIGELFQRNIHEALGQQVPNGWSHQISDGGELTGKYTVSLQKTVIRDDDRRGGDFELKTSVEANLGYSTDASAGLAWRYGIVGTPWWSFNPHQAEYINLGSPVVGGDEGGAWGEFYLWGGANVRYRLYNAILQGQFRESDVTFARSELNHVIGEAWVGLTKQLGTFRLSFVVRARTNEIRGPDARRPLWGGVMLSRAL